MSVLVVLNLVDALFTLLWVDFHDAQELNPLLAPMMGSPLLFVSTKLALVSLGVGLLWRFRDRHFARLMVDVAVIVYSFVCVAHVWCLITLYV